MIRIGVTQRVEVIEAYGERRDCLDQRWALLLEGLEMIAVPLPNSHLAPETVVKDLALNGFILTGGNDLACFAGAVQPAAERDKTEQAILDYAVQLGLPVLGVCRGMQMINSYCGGSLWAVEGHVATRHPVEAQNPVETQNIFNALIGFNAVNSYHRLGIFPGSMGQGLKAAVHANDGSVEAFYHHELPWVGIMWHPEREEPFNDRDRNLIEFIFRRQKGTAW